MVSGGFPCCHQSPQLGPRTVRGGESTGYIMLRSSCSKHHYISEKLSVHAIAFDQGRGHEFLMARILMLNTETIWARCERNPHMLKGILSLRTDDPPANDTIQLSYDRSKLVGILDRAIMQCSFDVLHVSQIVDLFNIIHTAQPLYSVASFNCWYV